jgi:hypothetical protein
MSRPWLICNKGLGSPMDKGEQVMVGWLMQRVIRLRLQADNPPFATSDLLLHRGGQGVDKTPAAMARPWVTLPWVTED